MANERNGNVSMIEFWRPLVWSAIVGGMVTALGIQLIFTLLGVGIGAALANPNSAGDASSMSGGAIAWLFISGIVSFAAGGFVAGCMSGVIRTGGGALHGIVAWSLAAVFGATVATLAGATAAGGAAAGAGAATGMAGSSNNSMTAPFSMVMRSGVASATGAGSGASGAAGGSDASSAGAGGTMLVDRYGRQLTESEARALADQASRAVAKASLWTALAFFVSMLAAALGGTLGRRGHVKLIPGAGQSGAWGTPATA